MAILFLQKWGRNTNFSEEQYKIIFTNESMKDMENISNYISEILYAPNSAKKLMQKVHNSIDNLRYMPKVYRVIKSYPRLQMEHRRIVINDYVIIYTVNEKEKVVYIINMYYGRSNYFTRI